MSILNRLNLCCYKNIHHCCTLNRAEHLKDHPTNYKSCLKIYSAKFLLEVCGAAGAIWGSSEILTLRTTPDSNTLWRSIAIQIFFIFLVRFWWHVKHYLERERDGFPEVKIRHRRVHWLSFFQIFGGKVVLEVLGAMGAVWGPAEVVGLRSVENGDSWRLACVIVGILFLMRWIYLILSYCLCVYKVPSALQSTTGLAEIFLAKPILEVFGASGAVWGFSEVIKLRHAENNTFWRIVAIIVGFLFFGRWIRQIVIYFREMRSRREANNDGIEVVYEEELGDLTFTESTV